MSGGRLPGGEGEPGLLGREREAGAPATVAVRSDPEARRALVARAYEEHQRDIYSFALHATRDGEAAADVTQEAFLRLLNELHRAGSPDNVRAWLYRVAANLVISRGRRTAIARRWIHLFDTRRDATESPEQSVLRRERSERIRDALDGVPADARVGLLLAASGFSGREVAEAIGRSELATRTLLCRARTRLRDSLGDEQAEPEARA